MSRERTYNIENNVLNHDPKNVFICTFLQNNWRLTIVYFKNYICMSIILKWVVATVCNLF